MAKKLKKKLSSRSPKKRDYSRSLLIPYLSVFTGVFLLVFVLKGAYRSFYPHVLGTTTFLAHEGDSGSSENSGSSGESTSGSSDSGHSGSGSSDSSGSSESSVQENTVTSQSQTITTSHVSNSNSNIQPTIAKFRDELKKTIEHEGEHALEQEEEKDEHEDEDLSSVDDTIEHQSFGKKDVLFHLENKGNTLDVRIDNGNGTERDVSSSILSSINSILQAHGLEIEKAEENTLVIKNGATQAKTQFPLSLDLSTRSLIVTTPNGVKKIVAVLPNQAVQNLISHNVITEVENASGSAVDAQTDTIELTELNSMPVFKVNGRVKEKLFGLIPVTLAKTAFVSAESGDVVKTETSFFTKLLDALSF